MKTFSEYINEERSAHNKEADALGRAMFPKTKYKEVKISLGTFKYRKTGKYEITLENSKKERYIISFDKSKGKEIEYIEYVVIGRGEVSKIDNPFNDEDVAIITKKLKGLIYQ